MQVTIGGDRVGSGKKMKAHLHNYYRSTHNLSEKFASSMGSGILYPCMCKLAMRGDSFDIDIAADCRTIPTQGPLFGSYKMQVDVYQVPIRLYQGILHNNPLKIGLNMSQVNFPLLVIGSSMGSGKSYGKMNDSSLMKYLGLSGLGRLGSGTTSYRQRYINAIPALGYYDIFKNYYANKQEDKAYVISADVKTKNIGMEESIKHRNGQLPEETYYFNSDSQISIITDVLYRFLPIVDTIVIKDLDKLSQENLDFEFLTIDYTVQDSETQSSYSYTLDDLARLQQQNVVTIDTPENLRIQATTIQTNEYDEEGRKIFYLQIAYLNRNSGYVFTDFTTLYDKVTEVVQLGNPLSIIPFDLTNIDDMRYDLLSHNRFGDTFYIEDKNGGEGDAYLPYSTLVKKDGLNITLNNYPLNGLVLKTYQNDIFNNWLNSEQIEGEGSITELTKVEVEDGKFSMDALSFAEKLYNMLNRIAVAGATYEDWQDVVYEEAKRRQIESPIFLGGMSQEVMFDEIVQNAPAEIDGKSTPLGTLGGRGRLIKESKKGGKIHIKVDEASFIIGIVSLTPRVFYSQGNEFYLTDVLTMDDLHKPAMDGIGFQDLIGERLAWWDTSIRNINGKYIPIRSKIGKLPAWIEYMTSYDRCYGDFAGEYGDKAGFMVLNRNYEFDTETGGIKDATTYVDPSKYNYAFADTKLEAQNFWVEVAFNIKARRLMSAKLIPSV